MHRSIAIGVSLLAVCAGVGGIAHAQQAPTAIVVAACGTPPATYNAGFPAPLTMNTSGQLCNAASGGGGGSGTVTSVGETFTGGLITVAGSPVTTAGTFALTVAGTSGGIPYFSSASTWATSAALAANALVIGGGAGAAPASTTTGTGVLTALGLTLNGSGALVATTNAALVTPALGVATATSLAVNGATLGTGNALAVTASTLGSTANFINTLNTGATFYTVINALAPNITVGQGASFNVGRDASTNDIATFFFKYAGANSASNNAGIVFFGGNPVLSVTAAGAVQINSNAFLTSPSAASLQLGAADAASIVAQTLSVQSIAAGAANTAGALWKHVGSLSTGSGVSGDISFQTGGTGAGATAQNTAVDALVIKGATQNIRLPAITSDAALTDSTVCQDTTNHALFSGSGTLGICLGTSSARYKHDVSDLGLGLHAIMGLQPKRYFLDRQHGDPAKPYYGFLAEDGVGVLPELVGNDNFGRPNTFDYLGIVPILVRAVQEQQVEIETLRRMVR